MTFEEFINELPNGLHDASLSGLTISYSAREVVAEISVNVTDNEPEQRERRLRLTLRGVAFLVMDPPDARYPFNEAQTLTIDAGPGQPSTSEITLPPIPANAALAWIYVYQWNSFIRFAAEEATYEWTSEPYTLCVVA
jgi:hypothetical protein